MYKGKVTHKFLEILRETSQSTAKMLDIFTSGYLTSYKKLRELPVAKHISLKEYKKQCDQRFYNMLYHLQCSGLVEKNTRKDATFWTITHKGKEMLEQIKNNLNMQLFNRPYIVHKSSDFIIVTFDIPEKFRRKRNWLRATLKRLHYTMIQKSVWIGKYALPAAFLEDLKTYSLLSYVQIFSINKKGTMGKI
ncbi:MAG: CRISPR-associated endonuclease Cas2 [bacterium]|nr:CRISPR-associated endonuclease Cas2 [bacterium]